jgi:hypothetical protein
VIKRRGNRFEGWGCLFMAAAAIGAWVLLVLYILHAWQS